MATDLYEMLDVDRDATPEQIRKAYKKRALQTHPDRLPAGSTPEDKTSAEEQFGKVNNAYEILTNPQNRKLYDMHGVWPPPGPQVDHHGSGRHHRRRHHQPFGRDIFNDPFFDDSFDSFPMHFTFTDPFVLFNSVFGDMHSFHHHHHGFRRDPFFPFDQRPRGLLDNIFNAARTPIHPGFGGRSILQSEYMSTPDNGWTQEVRMSSSVNGVTQSMWKRRDADGNVHIGRTHPDGRQIYTVNGVEQPLPPRNHDNGYIGLPSFPGMHREPRRSLTTGSRSDYAPPPQPIEYDAPQLPYPSSRNVHQPNDRHHHHYHHSQNPENGYPVIPDTTRPRPTGLPWKPKWWPSGS